jgi:4-nitrophenyl phosphatase
MDYKVLILDLDGTVYLDQKPIKNIVEKLNSHLKNDGEIIYLSNNTSISRKSYLDKLLNLGLNVSLEDIVTPVVVAGEYLKQKYSKGYTLGTKDFVNELINEYGINFEEKEPEFVLISFDRELTYSKLEKVCMFINNGIPYYITHVDLACPTINGPIPDCGAISLMIETVTDKKYLDHFGKPSMKMVDFIKSKVNKEKNALMVGDRIYTDMLLGNKLNFDTLLVLSGESDFNDYLNSNKIKIDYCSDTLADFFDKNNKT